MNKNNQIRQYLKLFIVLVYLNSLLLSVSVMGSDVLSFWLGVNTYHIDREPDEASNEQNKINAIFYNRWVYSSFINSYSKRSHLIGYHYWYWPHEKADYFYHYGITLAAATGYGRNLDTNIDGRITLGISTFIGGKYKLNQNWSIGADVLYLPTDNGGVLASGINLNYHF